MRCFRVYRQAPPERYRTDGYANAPDEPQFEGVVFTDGTVCVRWLTQYRSHSLWASWDDLMRVHGHGEYGSAVEWLDVAGTGPVLAVDLVYPGLALDDAVGRD